MFDFDAMAKRSGLSKAKVRTILREVRKEFPDDELLWELHVVRAIMKEGLYREQVAATQ